MPGETLQTRSRIESAAAPIGIAPRPSRTDSGARAVLLTELFPPAVGGSPVLLEAVYSRLTRTSVTVLADSGITGPTAVARHMTVLRQPIASRRWGVLAPKALWHHLRLVRRLSRVAGGRDVIVHCGRALPEGVAALLWRRLGGPDYVCWAHGEDIATAIHSREFTLLQQLIYRSAGAVVANSENTAGMLDELGVPRARIAVVHPGVDVRRFRPDVDPGGLRAQFVRGTEMLIVSVGRLQRRKGHDLAIEAVSRLTPATPVRYLIVGDGEERERLERLASARNVADRVHFVGEVAARELPRYYAACDVFLMPNRIENRDVEGFGIVFLEAAACGRPVIGGRSGGVPEAVLDGETGLLVSGTDADELAASLAHLAASPALRHEMGEAGRARVCRQFTWELAAARLEAVHTRLAAARYRGVVQ